MEQNMTGMTYKLRETAARIRELREITGITAEEMAVGASHDDGRSGSRSPAEGKNAPGSVEPFRVSCVSASDFY